MVRLTAAACILLCAANSSAQTTAPVHVSAGYRYMRGRVVTRDAPAANPKTIDAPTNGYDVSVAVRATGVLSFVAGLDHGRTASLAVPGAGIVGHPATKGDAVFSVTDVVGGAKLSRKGTGPFVQLLAGWSHPGVKYDRILSAGFSLSAMDQSKENVFLLRPAFGLDLGGRSMPVALRAEAGWDVLRASPFGGPPARVHHFRAGVSAVLALGPR